MRNLATTTQLQWSKFKPIVGLTSHSSGVSKITKNISR